MSNSIDRLVVNVRDLDAAKKFYATWLDAEPHTDTPYYVGFNVGGREVALAPGEPASVVFAEVENLDAARETLISAGATEVAPPRPAGPGQRVCTLSDADGNPIGLIGA